MCTNWGGGGRKGKGEGRVGGMGRGGEGRGARGMGARHSLIIFTTPNF